MIRDSKVRFSFFAVLFLILLGIDIASADSNLSDGYDYLFRLVTIISFVVFGLVAVLMARFIIKYREDVDGERKPIGHAMAKKLEAGWTLLAIVIIIALMAVSYPVLFKLDDSVATGTGETVIVEGTSAWTWVFHVKNDSGVYEAHKPAVNADGEKVTSMNLKVGKEYLFIFWSSGQWIHSFYAEGLNIKMDVVPGVNNTLSLTITEAGNYVVYCAEFCGAGHALMRGEIIAK